MDDSARKLKRSMCGLQAEVDRLWARAADLNEHFASAAKKIGEDMDCELSELELLAAKSAVVVVYAELRVRAALAAGDNVLADLGELE